MADYSDAANALVVLAAQTSYPREWQQQTIQAATLTLTVAGQQITVSGTLPTAGAVQNLAMVAGGSTYTYQASHADTLTSIATAFAALIPGASNVGPVITIPA